MFRKFLLGCIGAIVLLASIVFAAQTPNTSNLGLVGDRFKPLTWDQMTPEQKNASDRDGGHGGILGGPFNVLLRSPKMGDLTQKLGEYARFRPRFRRRFANWPSSLRPATGRLSLSGMRIVGLPHRRGSVNRSSRRLRIAKGRQGCKLDEEAAYNFANELMESKQVSDATFKAAVDKFGEKGVVDIIGVMGYYQMVSMLLNVDRYPLPAGATPELK
jgi:4-carboxymuconolactone decarboxylase